MSATALARIVAAKPLLDIAGTHIMIAIGHLPPARNRSSTGSMNAQEHVEAAFKYLQAAIGSLESAQRRLEEN